MKVDAEKPTKIPCVCRCATRQTEVFLSGRLDPAPVGLALGALAAIASAILLFRVHVEGRAEQSFEGVAPLPLPVSFGRQPARSAYRCKRQRGETRLGATRLAPEAARTCEGCEARPEQSVGDNRATQLIGAQRRVNARVRALAALDRKTLAAGTAGRLSGKGRAARYPTRNGTRRAVELASPWALMSTPRRGPIVP